MGTWENWPCSILRYAMRLEIKEIWEETILVIPFLEEAFENQAQLLRFASSAKQLMMIQIVKTLAACVTEIGQWAVEPHPLQGGCIIWARNKPLLLKPSNSLAMFVMLGKVSLCWLAYEKTTLSNSLKMKEIQSLVLWFIYVIKMEHYETFSLITFSKKSW